MNNPKRYTVTAALPYANGPLHIGHIAGVYVPADIYVRYLRMAGKDVVFVCGSDEHGAAITLKAKKEGKSPQEIVDEFHTINKESFRDFGIDFDIYHRTSDPLHHKTAQDFFLKLNDKGSFTQKTTEQYFDQEAQQFLADRYITGTCPKCGYENAYGDQCENCGSSLNPRDLIDPKSTLSGSKPVLRETSHWFLPMENHEAWLKEWIEKGVLDGKQQHDPKEWKKQVIGQCKSWIDGGLQPRAMTRDLDWGVKVPLEGAEGKVLYVWLDAPIGYISATKAWAEAEGKDWKPYWQSEDTKLVHFLAKDNIVFHCIIFPILLKEHGDFILPDNVPANEFLNLEGKKISTSRDWAVWLHEYLADFPDKVDELRYVLNAISPEFRDSEFTWEDYRSRVNNELVAVFGNFVNRTLVLTQKYYDGLVPKVGEKTLDTTQVDEAIVSA
ncbi:MAG TPA: methionine--tRNA ligase, partial [Cryomorphaceae bacterium]|nr:methionine--tRNA ligase [Cryomorphaceae bacterium]